MGRRVGDDFDVIVVGARCAGAPLAARLAAAGVRVCAVERARFPSEVPSTHMIHPNGVARLAELGVGEQLLATGAPPLVRGHFTLDDVALELTPAIASRFEAPWLCIRRSVLDPILVGAAEQAGAEVRTQTPAVGLVEDGGAVRGVRTRAGMLSAPLVVGADGPNSFVARAVGARSYHRTPAGRLFLWAYFEGAAAPEGFGALGRVGDVGFLAMHTDGGLFMAGVALTMAQRPAVLADVEGRFAEALFGVGPIADIVAPARRVGPVRTQTRWQGYFREAAGPGWVLVGDAGHFKDPTPAQGISDALRQGEQLAAAIVTGLGGGGDLPSLLHQWWKWRDDDAWEMYWFAADMGAAGSGSHLIPEMLRSLSHRPDGAEKLLRVLDRQAAPSQVFGAGLALRTLSGVSLRRPGKLPALLTEARTVLREDRRRRRLRSGRPNPVIPSDRRKPPPAPTSSAEPAP